MDRIEICEGGYIYRRTGSKKGTWQLYLYRQGQELKASLKTADEHEAVSRARKMAMEASGRADRGIRVRPSTFADAAAKFVDEALPELEPERKRGEYRRVIDSYLVPFFGPMELAKITDIEVDEYYRWRNRGRAALLAERQAEHERRLAIAAALAAGSRSRKRREAKPQPFRPGNLGRKLAASTINSENAVLRAVLDYAAKRRLMAKSEIPVIENASSGEFEPRGGFADKEVDKLLNVARKGFISALRVVAKANEQHVPNPLWPPAELPEGWGGDPWTLAKGHPLRVIYEEREKHRDVNGRYKLWHAIIVLAATGLRPDSLLRMRRRHVRRLADAEDGTPRVAMLASTGKGKKGGMTMEVVPEAWAVPAILRLAAGDPDAKLLDYSNSHALNKRFKALLEKTGLAEADGVERSLYSLRHYYITRKLSEGVSVAIVAVNTLTSVEMIEKHYNHMQASAVAHTLSLGKWRPHA